MATLTWIAATSGDWTTAANWSTDQVPGTGDTAVIDLPGTYVITETGAPAVGSVELDDAGAQIDFNNISIGDGLTVSAGIVDLSGLSNFVNNLTNMGTINVSSINIFGQLVLGGSVQGSAGTITNWNDNTLVIQGSVASAQLGSVIGNGELVVDGTLDNAGDTLGENGQNIIDEGLIVGGILVGALFEHSIADGVTLAGVSGALGGTTILDGLSGAAGFGAARFNILGGDVLDFANSETIAHLLLGAEGTIVAYTTLTVSSDVVEMLISDGNPPRLVFDGAGTVVNAGTFLTTSVQNIGALGFMNRPLTIRNADFENSGVLAAIDTGYALSPAQATLNIAAPTFDNQAGGIIEASQVFGTGFVTIAANTNFINNGTVSTWNQAAGSTGGTIDIATAVQGDGTIEINGGGLVTLETTTSSAQNIDFMGVGTLTLDQPQLVSARISGLGTNDAIVLSGVSATAISDTDGDLKLQTNNGTFDLDVAGDFPAPGLLQVTPTATQTTITIACLAAGSRVVTSRGAVKVEDLRIGDRVTTVTRTQQIIQWIGHRDVDCLHHPDPEAVWPVYIAAHAFGPYLPRRALLLSPDHAVFVDNSLVPIKYLINGTTIVQRQAVRITYYHIELPVHDILLAEGMPIESYLETGGRSAFANAGDVMRLHPNFTPDPFRVALVWEAYGYAPLAVTPAALAPIRARLQRQADALEAVSNRRPKAQPRAG